MATRSSLESLKIKAKLLQKAKKKIGQHLALKDAFARIAKASGYATWKEMKDSLDVSDILNPPHWSAQWKNWFATKDEALKHLTEKSFLLPYRNHFFICDENYIRSLGIEEDDADLEKVGRDFSLPRDKEAWPRLLRKIKSHIAK